MKTITITVGLSRDNDLSDLPVVAEHGPTRSKGFGRTAEDAVRDLFTCTKLVDAAKRCELPIENRRTA